MSVYELVPVGADGVQHEAAVRIEMLSYNELAFQNEQLSHALAKARLDAETWRQAWAVAVNNRIEDRDKLGRAMRVLASLGRLSPRMAALVAAARREVWGDLP